MKTFVLQTPASSANLGPGFDTLGLAVNLYNRFYFKLQEDNQSFSFTFKNPDLVSKDYDFTLKNNLLLKAYLHACKTRKVKPKGLEVVCDNQIPDSSGLGSSTTAILAGITASFVIDGKPINEKTKREILEIGFHFEKHPDNLTPCLYGGFCIGVMNQEKNDVFLTRYPLNNPNLKAFLIMPKNQRISTNQSRSQLTKKFSLEKVIFNSSRTALLSSCLISGKFSLLKVAMQDAVHQNKRLKQSNEASNFNQLLLALEREEGFYGLSLSGSGPSLLILSSPMLVKSKVETICNTIYDTNPFIFDCQFDNLGILSN